MAPLPPSEPVYEVDDDRAWHAHVLERLDSLKTWLALVTVLALLALAGAAYALLADDDDDTTRTRSGASTASVSSLEERVDDLESRLDDRATKSSVSDVASDQKATDDRLEALEKAAKDAPDPAATPEGGQDTQAIQQSVDDLTTVVEELSKRVDEIEQSQAP